MIVLICYILLQIINIYTLIIFVSCIMSFIPQIYTNRYTRPVALFIYRITNPLFAAVRRVIPTQLGGFDFSPIAVLFGLQLLARGIAMIGMKFA